MRSPFARLPRPWRLVLDWLSTVALAIGFVLVFEAEVAKPFRIPSASMEPTLHCARPASGCHARFSDRVIALRLAYRFREPRRGEIVVFKAPAAAALDCGGQGGVFVKRLVGLPGDVVSERNGWIFINGKRLSEPYIKPAYRDSETSSWPRIQPGHYFMLGDNRRDSCDSRAWGTVARADLVGPAVLTYWPPTRLVARVR
jgi:signal peptidase I